MAYRWVQSSAYSSIPANAVVGGNDEDGAMIYVGRAEHEGDQLVCKVVPSKQIGFISQRGEALPKDVFEVLCSQNVAWIKCYDHVIPETAILCGRTSLDQPVYIGRGHYEGHLIIGKISSVHRALFIAYRGAERRLDSYEILIEERRSMPGWQLPPPSPEAPEVEKCPLTPPPPPYPPAPAPPVAEKPFRYPPPLDMGGMPFPQYDRPPMYTPPEPQPVPVPPPQPIIVVAPPPQTAVPPTPAVVASFTPAAVAPPVASFTPAAVAPPVVASSSMIPAATYQPPLNPYAPSCSSTYTHAEYAPPSVYGAGCYDYDYDLWVNMGPGYFYSPDAVIGGHDSNMSQLLVCRTYHHGHHVPGKASPSQGYAFITYAGMEIAESNYEVLMGQGKYHWVRGYEGSIAPGAVQAGRAMSGEPLYIGRAHYCGTLTPGKLQQSHRCLQIPFNGQEIRISSYEVLVRSDLYHRQQAISFSY